MYCCSRFKAVTAPICRCTQFQELTGRFCRSSQGGHFLIGLSIRDKLHQVSFEIVAMNDANPMCFPGGRNKGRGRESFLESSAAMKTPDPCSSFRIRAASLQDVALQSYGPSTRCENILPVIQRFVGELLRHCRLFVVDWCPCDATRDILSEQPARRGGGIPARSLRWARGVRRTEYLMRDS